MSDTIEIKPIKMSFIKLAFAPFAWLVDNFGKAFLLMLPYALALSALSLALGFGYVCRYSQFKEVDFYCSGNVIMFVVSLLLNFFLVSMFTVKYSEVIFGGQPIRIKTLFKPDLKTLKVFLTYLSYLLTGVFPFISLYLLYIRVPTPDWRLELVYFAVVSVGFFVPFAALRTFSLVGFFALGEPAPKLKGLWMMTKNNNLKILFSILLIFILFIFVVFQFYVNFINAVDENPIYIGIISTILYDFFMLMVFSIFINHCIMQKQLLQE